MPLIKTDKKTSGLARYQEVDGYEQGGLIYFRFEGREMVAAIRDRSEFDKNRKLGTSLQDYVNTVVSDKAYGAALAIEELIPKMEVSW